MKVWLVVCVCVCEWVRKRRREREIKRERKRDGLLNHSAWVSAKPGTMTSLFSSSPRCPPMVCPNMICCTKRTEQQTNERGRIKTTTTLHAFRFSDACFNEFSWSPPTAKGFTFSTDKRRGQRLLHKIHHKEPHTHTLTHSLWIHWFSTITFSLGYLAVGSISIFFFAKQKNTTTKKGDLYFSNREIKLSISIFIQSLR